MATAEQLLQDACEDGIASLRGTDLLRVTAQLLSNPPEPPFGPPSIAGLFQWLTAYSYVNEGVPDNTVIGGPGLQWIDQSLEGNDGTTGSGLVTFQTDGIAGAFPCLEIGGSTLVIPDIVVPGDFTIIVVAETLGDTAWLGNVAANVQIRKRRSGANNASFFPNAPPEIISDNFGSGISDLVMTTWRRSGTTVSFRENKTARNSGSNGGAFTMNRIGVSQFVGGIGNLGEIVYYTQALSDVAVDNLYDNYFKDNWPLP